MNARRCNGRWGAVVITAVMGMAGRPGSAEAGQAVSTVTLLSVAAGGVGRSQTMRLSGSMPGIPVPARPFSRGPYKVRSPLDHLGAGAAGAPAADFNSDGRVDFADFLSFAAAYGARDGQPGFDRRYDLSANGVVDFADFLLFAGAFGR